MAEKPDYDIGTVSVGVNGTTVTGVGTFWATADFRPGDMFGALGYPMTRIVEVLSNTSMTIEPWRGAALAAGSSYFVRYQPDGSRFTAALRILLASLTGGSLSALQSLTGAANKIPRFTGVNTMDLVDYVPPQSSSIDFTSGRLVTTDGAPGAALAAFGTYNTTGNLDAAQAGDVGLYISTIPGTPSIPGVTFYKIKTEKMYSAANALFQEAISYPSASRPESFKLCRTKSPVDGTWSSWASASSVSGFNANGTFVRHADGRLEVRRFTTAITSVSGGVATATFPWPVNFVGNPQVFATSITSNPMRFDATASGTSSTLTVNLSDTGPGAALAVQVSIRAEGTWY